MSRLMLHEVKVNLQERHRTLLGYKAQFAPSVYSLHFLFRVLSSPD